MNKLDVIQLINEYLAHCGSDQHALKTLDFVGNNDQFWQRENIEGHVTASAWLVDFSNQKVLLIHHPKLLQWFQPGGHVEPSDLTIYDAAIREAREETGILQLTISDKAIFDLDVHTIPSHKATLQHYHYDIRIFVEASSKAPKIESIKEVHSYQWIALDKVSDYNNNTSILRMVDKTLERMGLRF